MHSLRAILASIAITEAARCAAPPLNVPLRRLSVTPGTISKGIPISIGTPPQHVVLTPSLQLDTSFVPRYTNSCTHDANTVFPSSDTRWKDQDGKTVCAGIYGGAFDPGLSTTFYDNKTNSPVSEGWFRKMQFSNWHFMTDEFVFLDYLEAYVQQNEALPGKRTCNSTFILPDEDATFGGLSNSVLGLTPNSRTLETLYGEGMIASKSWSLSNDSLCLGCIDVNAHTGDFQDFKVADRQQDGGLPCLLQVKVESLDYHADDTSVGVALLDTAYVACIEPGVSFSVLSADARAKLPKVAGAISEASAGSTSFLRFRIKGGLEVDVGTTELRTGDAGAQLLSTQTGSWGAYGEGVPVLGAPFTDNIVLKWDETTQEYGLANRLLKPSGKKDLVPLGCDDFPSVSRSVETTPSVGIIVGSIIGGFVAGLMFAAAAVFFYWRGQSGVKGKYEAMRGDDAVSLRTIDSGGRTLESRMSNTSIAPTPSLRESIWSRFSQRTILPFKEAYLVGDGQVFEAPEGGTAYPSKRSRSEMSVYP
ncbi:hypothetical protein OPT61_g3434 [Boeremia exigua]|uniref:Uncharacterized protein n=1 Tax=Boeremia exigua TaxID=749465 RepID=A0ACC2IHY0_9PLEO|nr:hypothetical protein OPT61_g3434 [Boeremia exigua]